MKHWFTALVAIIVGIFLLIYGGLALAVTFSIFMNSGSLNG